MRSQCRALILTPLSLSAVALLLLANVISVCSTGEPVVTRTEYPRFTNVLELAGNARSVEFLKWARAQGIAFDGVELDEDGDITFLVVHVCYFVKDKDLQVISTLPRLNELVFVTDNVTASGIQQLEATTTLRKLSIGIVQRTAVLNDALQRLKAKNPELVIES